jgi:DNA segregation ATPase FtsK/SpoIIIE, S-DNA-T family
MSPTPTFFDLHGVDGPQFDPQSIWLEKASTGTLTIPIGVDPEGSPVVLDFTRWTSLDDHVAVVGAPDAGTTTVLRAVMLGLSLSRSPDPINLIVAEGKPGVSEYADAPDLPHCVGHVTFTGDETGRLARRLATALIGEVDRRKELLRAAGVTNLDDYRQASKMRSALQPLPDTFVILDDITWLQPGFDAALGSLVDGGHRLGLRLVVGIPYPEWETLSRSGVSDGFSARVAVGLSKQQASSVLAPDVPDDVTTAGQGYFTHLGGHPVRVALLSADTSVE